MTLKIAPPSPEEHAFACQVNDRLVGTGARVVSFTLVNPKNQARTYHLTVQAGSKRTVLTADAPFHYDPPEDVVAKVKEWIGSASAGERWTTDLERADGAAW
jgi:hypothetical protein